MQIAKVIGHATATIKHPTLKGWRLLIVQPMSEQGKPDGDPQLAIDRFGGLIGQNVIISSDGGYARDLVGSKQTPARWAVMGLRDS